MLTSERFEREFDKLKDEFKSFKKSPNEMIKSLDKRFQKLIGMSLSEIQHKEFFKPKFSELLDIFTEPSFELSELFDFWELEKEIMFQEIFFYIATGDQDRIVLFNLENIFQSPIIINNVNNFDRNVVLERNKRYIIIYDEQNGRLIPEKLKAKGICFKTVERLNNQAKYFTEIKQPLPLYTPLKSPVVEAGGKSQAEMESEIKDIFNGLIKSFGSLQNILKAVNLI